MNKIFKVIWSKSKQCYIVVSEIAKNKTGKKKIVVASILVALAMQSGMIADVMAADPPSAKLADAALAVGTNGVAIGSSAKSQSNQSVAIGYFSNAQAPSASPENPATAVGAGANANGAGTVALGLSANATGANAVALGGGSNGGKNKTEATAVETTAVGFNAKASNSRAAAIGSGAGASGSDSIAMGTSTVADSEKAIAIGANSKGTAIGATALGRDTEASGASATALGALASAKGSTATAVGMQASASGTDSVAVGKTASATNNRALAVGTNAKATGENSVAVGSGAGGSGALGFAGSLNSTAGVVNTIRTINYATTADGDNAVALGFYANAKNSGVAVGQNALAATGGVAIGKGVLEDTGNNLAGGVVMGQDSATLGPYSLAMGFNAFASGSTSMAVGHTVSAQGAYAVAMGRKVSATGTSTAIGHHATATNGGLAIGSQENDASNDRTTASAKGAIAIGKNTKATSEDAVAIGTNAEANRLYSVALGSGSTTATGATNQGSTTINGITYNFAGATGNPNMQVSVGNTGATRQIKNVAAGEVSATSTDAINGSQLYAVASAVKPLKYVSINSTATGTGSNVDNDGAQAPNSIAIGPSSTVTNQNSVALGNNAQSLSDDSIAIGRNAKAESGSVFTNTSRAIAIGSNSRVATNVVQGIAIGSGSLTDEGAVVTGDQSIAIGGNVKVDGHAAIAIGGDDARKAAGQQVSYTNTNDNEVTGTLQTAILNLTGYNLSNYKGTAASHAGVAYGTSALAGNAGVAIGTASDSMTRMNDKGQVVNNKPVTNAVAIGTGARANFDNSVAIGGGSNTDHYATKQVNAVIDGVEVKWSGGENISPGDVVSFGAKGFERQLKNVAPGEVSQTSTDAVNGSQIYSLARKVTNIMNGGSGSVVNVNATGEPLSKVVTGTGASKVEKYYRTVDVKDDGTLVTGAVAQTPTSLALVNVDQTDTNKQTQTPRILGNVANGVKDNDAVNVSQLNAAKVKYFSVNSSDAGNINNDGATGTDAIAIGPSAVSNAVGSVALGKDAKANGAFTVALGGGNWQFKGAQANGVGTTALGSNTKTQENINYQTAIGFGATTSAESALALGYNAAASAQNAIALGKGAFTSGQDSLAFGVNSEAKGGSALAMGPSAQANSNYVVSLGYQANNGATNNANGVSIGWAAGMQSNGSSNVGIGSGAGRQISGNNNVSIGNGAGNLASANLYTSDSIMLGSEARAINGTASKAVSSVIAIGKKASGGADSAIALGQGASSTNQNSIAIGTNSQATAYNGVAIGAYSVANTAGGVAGFNPNTSRTDTYSGLTGRALTSTTGAVAIGSDSQSRQLTGLAAGTQDTDAVNVAQLKSVNLAFKGNAGTGDVNLAAHPLTIQGNDNYITTSANGNTINISGKVQNITVTNGTATAANKGMADAQNVADAINNAVQSNAYKWKLTANGEATPETIAKDDTVDFSGDTNISVARNGKKITTSLKKDITVDSVKVNKSITTGSGSNQITLDGTSGAVTGRTFSGQSFAAGDNVLSNTTLQIGSTTNGNNVTITKDGLTSKAGSTTAKFGATGIDAGGQRITNVSSGGNVGTNAANITDVKNAVSDVTLKLDTNSKTGTVKLSDGSLKIVGANGIRTDLTGTNKDNLVIGLDSNTVNATTKGIGLSGDSGTMLRKFLKDGDADFKISGDGNLVTTVGSAAGVKVSVDSTKVKDLAVEAVTVSKANTVDNPITVTPIASTNSKDYAIGIDTTKLAAKTDLTYRANSAADANAKKISLSKGLNFVDGGSTVATVDNDGKVSFDLNTATKNQISTNTTNIATNTTDIAANKGNITKNTASIATNTAALARNISLGADTGTASSQSLSTADVAFNVKGATGDFISTNMNGNTVEISTTRATINSNATTGEASVTGNDGLATAKNVADAINKAADAAKAGAAWNITTNSSTTDKTAVKGGDTVDLVNGDNIEITQDGTDKKKITVATKKDITVDSVTANNKVTVGSGANKITLDGTDGSVTGKTFTGTTFTGTSFTGTSFTAGNTVINTNGLTNGTTAITGTGVTTDNVTVGGISIDKTTGINAGNNVISNVASGGTTLTNAANIGDVQNAVANLSQNLNITDGTHDGTVDLKNQKLNVAGANGVTATVNNQTITVGLDADTVNATTKGIGLTADTGSTGNKYLKDGDVSFAVTGDGSLVSTSATAAGVKVAVNSATITAGADGTVTGPTTDGVATAKNVADAINAAKKASKTEITANTGEATNATTGNVTLTSTTAADGHTIYDVKLNDKVTLGTGANAVTIDGTTGAITGKTATIGGVTVNGTANTIGGLSNTTWNGTAVSGRAATEDQLKAATGATTLKFTGDVATNTGSVNLKDDTFGIKGDGKYISTDVNGKNVNLTVSEAEVKKSAVAAVTVSTDTTDANNPLTVTPTTSADGTTKDYKVTIDGTKIANKTNLSYKANNGTAKQVSLADGLNFKNGTLTTASIDDAGVVKYDVNTASITAGTDGTITGPTTDGVATAQNVADAINAAKKASKTEITANTGEAANATTGNVTLTSSTAVDGHTIYDVKLNDKVTLGSGANAVTIDGTAGKATIGSSIVDGVNSTFTTGGANAVKLDGAAGTIKTGTVTVTGGTTNDITGLSNTTVTSADFATKGRAATEEQLKAVGEQTWQITADKDATTSGAQTGTKKDAKVGKNDKVQLIAGENMTVNQNERDFTFTLNKDLVKMNSATFEATGGKTTVIKGDSIVQTDGANVNTSNATSNTITDGTNTSTITAGKAQIGTVGIDGVVSKISTGGTNAVVVNGADGTIKTGNVTVTGGTTNDITGLSNTTVTAADFATKGRAATEEQLKAATGATTLKFTGDVATNTGSVNLKDDTFGIKGDNKYISTDVNGKNVNLTVSEAEVKKSAVAAVTVSTDTTDANNPLTVTPTTSADGTTKDYKVTIDGTKIANKTNLSYKANGGTAKQVSLADGLDFTNGTLTTASIDDKGVVKYDVNTASITAGTDGTITGPATDGVATAKNVADAINAAKKASKTEITANTGEAANATTGNVTLTSTTAADGHTIYDVKLNDKVTLGTGANAVTVDGTAAKVTAGVTTVDGATGTITTGGTNSIKVDGATGTVTGLTNKDWTPGVTKAVTGRAATEDQLQKVADAASSQTWNITADKAGTTGAQTGTKKNATVGKDETVELVAGDNLTINQDERKFTYSLNKDLAGLTSVSIGTGTTGTIKLDGATGKITAKNAVIGGVTVDGDNNHVTGLANTTWNGTATTGRAATEDQLKAVAETAKTTTDAVNLKFSGNTNTSPGVVNLKDDTFGIVGDGKYVSTDANGKNLTVKVSEAEVKKSAVAAVTVSTDTTDANNPLTVTPTTSADGTTKDYKVTIDGTKIANKTNLSYKANDGTPKQVSLADGLNFKNGTLTTASIDDNGVVKYDVNTASITAGADGTITGPTTDGVATAQNVADAINAAKKASKTEITANTGEAANATTGNVTLTSSTAVDGHTIYDVKLNDKVTLGSGANAVTIDGTAGKATIGSSVINGINNTFTTGGAKAVTLDGATGTITGTTANIGGVTVNGTANTIGGLSNTTWNGTATTGRAATEDQLKAVADAAGSQTWEITADKDTATSGAQTGTKKDAKVGKDDKVQLIAGENLTVNQNERDFTYSLNKDLVKMNSATFEATGGKTTVIKGDSIVQTDGANVNTSNATSNTITDGTNTSTITAGKAQIGTVGIDGVVSKISTGGTNAVVVNGADGTIKTGNVTVTGGTTNDITGLSNTTVTAADFATKGRAATEEQLKAATGATTLKFTGDVATNTGSVNLKDDTFGIKGDGKYISTDVNGKNVNLTISEAEVKKSAVAAVTVSADTTDANNPLTVTPTTSADGTTKDYKVTIDGTKIANKTNLSYKANDGTAKQVSLADGLNFKNGTLTTASIDDNGVVKYDVNTASITAGADGTITGPTTDGVATAQNVADAINAAKKASKTEITANTGEAANATTGNVTLTSSTAVDGHTIYDVKLNDKVTLGSGANAVTIDGTAGKATIGSSIVDGVNNTFTTGGASPVTLNGATGTITGKTANIGGVTIDGTNNHVMGLANKDWTPGVTQAVSGRAATEDQLQKVSDAVGAGWKVNTGKVTGSTGESNGAASTKVASGEEVQFQAGNNLIVDQNGKTVAYSLSKALKDLESATFNGTGTNKTVITGDSITQTAGTQMNTSTAGGNTVADGTKSTETTAAGQVIKDGAKSNKSTVDNNVIDDGNGNVNTSNATSNTITDGTNTTATTSSSVTVKDNAGNSTVITKDNITTGVGGNKITLDGTAGKATVGASVIDGVNNTFTTGGANAVKLDGVAGTIKTGTVTVTGGTTNDITGLSNTTVTAADFATKGRAATEEQLKAVGEQTWQITADKDATTSGAQTGTKKDAKVGKDDKVQLIAGENMTVNQNERDFTFTLNKDLVKMNSATFLGTGTNKTVITGDSITQTAGTQTNTSTAAGNTVADGTKSTETTAAGQVIKDGAKSNKSTVSSNVIDDGNGNVNTSNATSNIITDGTNTSTITAGKATIGSSIVDGVNNTFTTGGANAVKLDGVAGTIKTGTVTITGGTTNDITGLSNTTVTAADFATKGRAATEEQLKAVGEQTWQITADKDTTTSGAQTGTKKNAKVGKDDKVQLIAGENLTVNQNERDFTYSLNKDLVKMNSATFEATGGRTTVIKGDSIVQTDGTKVNISTAGGSTVADGTKSTETTADGQVIKDGAKSNKSTVDSNVIDDGNGNVNTSNATSNTITDGTNTSTVTAGKAQIGTVGIDGVASKITTGGANAVVINGADGTVKTGTVTVIGGTTNDITGLSNTTVTAADFATKGRAATEEQLKAVGEQTWQITADKDATTSGVQTGTKKDAKVGKDDKVQLIAGENLTVNQNERDFTYSLNKDLVKMNSATFEATGGKTTVIKGDSIVQTDGTKVNTSTAAGNTVVDGAKSTATTADGTTVTTANGNTNYAADGVRINTTGKTPVSLTDAGLDNGNNVIKNVASGHVNNDATDNTNAANIADVKKATTTVTANAGEAANATKGNVTLTSTTAADGHTIYDVKLNDKVTLGTGANAVTIDGTAGKATVGSSVIDGVNNTFTTGGANAVKLDGAAGTIKTGTVTVTGGTTNDITGLSNTTVNSADFATKGRAATEEQLKAVGEQTWQITADKDATTSGAQTGTKKDAKVGKDDKVQLIAGENMTVNQNERDFTFTLNKDLVKMNSATFLGTGSNTTVITGNSITQTAGTQTNTSTAAGNTIANGTKSTETTADGQVIKDGTKTNTSTVDENTLVDGAKSNKATVDSNVVDDGNGNVNTSNATSNTITDGTNRSTITAGKATIGSSVIDGVNNTFITGGANAVKLDGAAGTIKTGTVTVTGGTTNDITGLSNTTVTSADFATKGRAATEEQLKAVGEQTWQITADKDATTSGAQTGTKKDAKVGKDDKVQLIAGENMTVNQNERDFTFTLNKDLVKMNSATFLGTGSNTTVITGNSITQTAGTQTNTSTAGGNTVADGTKSTKTTADGQVIKDGTKSNKSTVDNNVIDDGNGNVNTSNATSNTITDGTNTTATTSSSVTVKDNAGNSTVITKDNVTTGVGANKIILDGTAGKATIGSSVVDGVNNTFTTGGTNAVTLDGGAGTIKTGTVTVTGGTTNDITGLSNTTVNSADFATKGRAATEEQLKAVGEQTWQITADKDTATSGAQTGTKKDAKVGKDNKVQLIAGENMTINQNERDFTFTLNKDLVKMNSATFLGTGSNTTVITGNSITQTAGTQTNTSTAGGNTVADGTKSTETTAAGQVIKDGAKTNKSTVDTNVIDDGNGNKNISNATSNTITDGTNTSTITAGKANIGNIAVDGVNNKITMGNGANPVTLDGANGHLDGLTNTTWVPGVTKATTGRAATEDQLQQVSDAVGAGWKVNTGTVAGSSGVSNGAASTKVSSGEEVKLQAGDNLVIDQNGKTVSYSLNKDLTKMNSATFEATGGKTTVIKGDSIIQTDGGKTNTSTAAGNTVVDGNKSTATTAAGTTITDGAKTNTSTADKNVINDGVGNTNTSTATSNTLKNAAGDETKADAKGVTVKDAAGNNATFNKDGITITKTGKDTVSLTSNGLDNGNNKIVNVAAGVANTDAVNVGQLKEYAAKSTTELTANGGQPAGSTTGNIVLTKTTAADGHTIYDNKLNDKITLGTDPTKAVTVDGTTGTVTGLTNKTWTPGSIVSGRAATEDQLKEAVADSGWKAAVDKEGSGQSTVVGTSPEKIKAEETVTFKAGNNMMVTQTGKSISYAVNPELTDMKSATFKDAAGNTTVTNGNGITITPGSANPTNPHAGPVSLTKDGLNNGNNQIKGVAPGTDPTDAVNVSQLNASNANTSQAINQIAGEVQHVGAHAAAMAALKPIQYDPLEPTQVMAGVGNYRGETAAALGLAHYTNENTMFNVGVSVGGNHNMVNAGVTHKFGYSPEKKNIPDRYKAGPISSVYVMQDEVSSLKKENAEQKYVIADQAARLTTLEAENEQQRRELAETKKGLDDLKAAVDKLLASKG